MFRLSHCPPSRPRSTMLLHFLSPPTRSRLGPSLSMTGSDPPRRLHQPRRREFVSLSACAPLLEAAHRRFHFINKAAVRKSLNSLRVVYYFNRHAGLFKSSQHGVAFWACFASLLTTFSASVPHEAMPPSSGGGATDGRPRPSLSDLPKQNATARSSGRSKTRTASGFNVLLTVSPARRRGTRPTTTRLPPRHPVPTAPARCPGVLVAQQLPRQRRFCQPIAPP